MHIYIKLITIPCVFLALAACSPPEPPSETFLDGHIKAINKAKNVEKLLLDQKKDLDQTIEQASNSNHQND